MLDNHKRVVNYLRISVTDRCNFRCVYCMPPQGANWLEHSEILTYEELLRLVSVFNREGISKVRITGGEPLVRPGLVDFITNLSSLGVIEDISLTTNGSLLPPMAYDLKAAGLHRVNISLDTVNPASFSRITTCGRLEDTLQGIQSALAAQLTPVKLNVVLTEVLRESDLAFFIEQVYRHPISVRFIEYMPIGGDGINSGPDIATVKKLLRSAAGRQKLWPVANVKGNGPARYYQFPQTKGAFGFITPISEHFCAECNRLRLTADGKLRPCLLSNREVDIKTPLRNGASDSELAGLFHTAVQAKPQGHMLCRASGYPDFKRKMSQIGG
jgi:cyclic pyranopterin phosphate synthase